MVLSGMAGGVVQAGGEEREKGRGEDGHGVLLYYKYLDLGRLEGQKEELAVWMEAMCSGLGQVGRVRVALDGLNVTVRKSADNS